MSVICRRECRAMVLTAKTFFVASPGDEALSQGCSRVSYAGSRHAKPGRLLVSEQEHIRLLILQMLRGKFL